MRGRLFVCALAIVAPCVAWAQVPRPTPTSKKDSVARADSIAKADSIALVRELEKMQGQDTIRGAGGPVGPQGGATNPRLIPDISAVGDFVGDFSPKGSTQEDLTRFGVREVELAFQAAVDPFFRGDVFLGISDLEKISIEQAFLTTTSLPNEFELRIGRYLMPVGKLNTTHRHDLHTIEYPYIFQKYFSPDGLKGTGLWLSRVIAPLGFYEEIQLTVVDRFGEKPEDLTADEPANKELSGLGYSARLRNYWDLTQAANLEIGFSGMTGKREQPLLGSVNGINAVNERQSVIGADLTYRWRPLQQGLYKSFILQAEIMQQRNPDAISSVFNTPAGPIDFGGPTRNFTGGYVFGRYQITTRGFLGARFDMLEDPELDGANTKAASGYLEFFPSEFSKLVGSYERYMPGAGQTAINRFLIQAVFALGPHKPHPF
jgi:hypothetical protein